MARSFLGSAMHIKRAQAYRVRVCVCVPDMTDLEAPDRAWGGVPLLALDGMARSQGFHVPHRLP